MYNQRLFYIVQALFRHTAYIQMGMASDQYEYVHSDISLHRLDLFRPTVFTGMASNPIQTNMSMYNQTLLYIDQTLFGTTDLTGMASDPVLKYY